MSCRTIVYKGMFLAPQLFAYYPDLADPRVLTALAIVHQRYSTNTFPSWQLAQPFRMIAHNGEINTLRGQRQPAAGLREDAWPARRWRDDLSEPVPDLEPGGSDSACFDNVDGAAGPRRPLGAARLDDDDPRGLRAAVSHLAPTSGRSTSTTPRSWSPGTARRRWSSPTAGWSAARWTATACGPAATWSPPTAWWCWPARSGVIEFPPEQIQQKGPPSAGPHVPGRHRGGPDRRRQRDQGQDRPAEALPPLAGGEPHRVARPVPAVAAPTPIDPKTLAQRLRAFGYTREDLQMMLAPMAANGQEPVGSMGTDTPLAVLSERPKLLFNYFKQLFAQVTNPPIDPLREGLVMSLMSFTGKQRNLLDETPRALPATEAAAPDPDQRGHASGCGRRRRDDFKVVTLPAVFDADAADPGRRAGAGAGRAGRCGGEQAIRDGASLLIVSDRDISPPAGPDSQPAGHRGPAPRAAWTGGCGARRASCVESGEPREVMHFCLLCGYGANADQSLPGLRGHPQTARRRRPAAGRPRWTQLTDHYITAVKKGILKTMSKMGISTLRSYHAAQQFEAVGLNRDVIDKYFTGTASRIGGRGPGRDRPRGPGRGTAPAFGRPQPGSLELDFGGEYHFRLDGEKHLWNPDDDHPAAARGAAERPRRLTPSTPRRSTTRAASL